MRIQTSRTATWASLAFVAALAFPALSAARSQDAPKPPKEKTLYARMGGYDVLAGVTDDFLHQLGGDERFKRFGGGRSMGSLQRARQLIVDQVCSLTGGPCVYFGREMKPAHEGLAITKAEWDASVVMLKNSLVKMKVMEPEQSEFLAIIDKMQKDIVEPPKKESY